MESVLDNMKRATQAIIDGFNTGDVDLLMSVRTPDCTQHIGPKSLNRTPRNNEQFREHVTRVYDLLKGMKFVADNIIFDAENRKCAFHATATATSPLGPFENEYSFFLWFDESGEKISKIYEMVDSAISEKLFAAFKQFREDGGEAVKEGS